MANFLKKLFGRAEQKKEPQQQVSELLKKYDVEYIRYCIEQEQVVSALEANLHTSDDPQEIAMQTLKTACAFYGGDWAGILEVDLDLGVWTPVWWYNPGIKDRTTQLMREFENAAVMPTWIKSMEQGRSINITDINEFKDSRPEEYAVYQRLRVQSVIAAPFAPNPMGFLVIRNPSRYAARPSMMNVLAYVLHRAMAQQKTLDSAKLSLSPEAIQNDKDIIINFFGDMEICTCQGILREKDFNSPKSSRVVTYLMLNRRAAHPPLAIHSALWPDDNTDPDAIGSNIRGCIYRFRQAFALISKHPLIESTTGGYRINPELNIMTDIDQFERLTKAAQQAVSVSQRVSLLKQAVEFYRGPLFKAASDEHWIIGQVNHYRIQYASLVNELLTELATAKDYTCVHHYAQMSIRIMPGNLRAYYWLIISLCYIGTLDLARQEWMRAKDALTVEEHEALTAMLKQSEEFSAQELKT